MKTTNKTLATLLAIIMLIGMSRLPASAATTATILTFARTSDIELPVGYYITRVAAAKPEALTVTYTSGAPDVALVDGRGKVVGVKPGKTVITAAAGGLITSYNVTVVPAPDAIVGTKVFDGYNVTILDKATPAVDLRGRTDDRTVMCFVSADDREIGVISYSDHWAIIEKYKTVVELPAGGTLTNPPDGYTNWNVWFADEFNKLRGIGAGSREAAIEAHTATTIEEYRQEIVRLVNIEREKAGLPSLAVDDKAMEYAQVRAQEIVVSFSHTRPNGLEKPYDEIGAMTENIAGGGTPEAVMNAWIESPGHRGNILNDDAFAIGVGCHWTGTSYSWVQIFLW
jgi:hypothetical protein